MVQPLRLLIVLLLAVPATLIAQTPFENGGLEDWVDTLGYPELDGAWTSHNVWGGANNITDWAMEKNFINPQSDLFCARLETKIGDVFNLDLFRKYIPGVVTNGECALPPLSQTADELGIDETFVTGGQEWTERPSKMTGYWEYEPAAGGDSAWAFIRLWQNDGTVIGEGEAIADASTAGEYVMFEIDINYTSTDNPDSMLVYIASSVNPREAVVGSVLYLDNIALEYEVIDTTSSINETFAEQQGIKVKLFPNPATESLFLENPYNEAATVTVFNSLGDVVIEQLMPARFTQEISVADIPAGAYLYRIATSKVLVADGMFQVR